MNRARFSFAATLVAAIILGAGILAAQATQAPPMQSVLAGKKLTPPARGEVVVEYKLLGSKPGKKDGEPIVVTTFQVRNPGTAPIARLGITETFFDKASNIVGGGKGVIEGLLQPGEEKTIIIESAYKPSFNGNGFNFTHANGTVKPQKWPTAAAGAKAPAAAGAKAPAAAAAAKK